MQNRLVRRAPALLLAGLLLAGCGMLKPEAEEPQVTVQPAVTTQREVSAVKRGPIESRLSVNVSIGSARQNSLYLRGGGRLKRLYASPGQHVAAGDLLAELEAGTIPYDLAQAQVDLERAKLALETARSKKGFVDGPTPDQLQRDELDVQTAELKLQRQQELAESVRLTAPYAGTVVSVAANEGDNVNAYAELMVIAADGIPVARATVDDATAAQIQPGMAADIFPSDGNPTPVRGKVLSVQPVGNTGAARAVVIQPDAETRRLTVGRNGKAEIVTQSKPDALLVPLSAMRTFGGRTFVTVQRGGGRQEVAITVGIQSDTYAEVLSGLQAGDQVVGR